MCCVACRTLQTWWRQRLCSRSGRRPSARRAKQRRPRSPSNSEHEHTGAAPSLAAIFWQHLSCHHGVALGSTLLDTLVRHVNQQQHAALAGEQSCASDTWEACLHPGTLSLHPVLSLKTSGTGPFGTLCPVSSFIAHAACSKAQHEEHIPDGCSS